MVYLTGEICSICIILYCQLEKGEFAMHTEDLSIYDNMLLLWKVGINHLNKRKKKYLIQIHLPKTA